MENKAARYKTIILSDVHLGSRDCKIEEVNHFLKHTRCEKLILNGDIIDGWKLRQGGSWTKGHTRFVRLVLKKLEKKGTEVIYLRGNHDDILAKFLPIDFERLRIVEDYLHTGAGGKYLVLHGDLFDTVTKNFVFLAYAGDWGYSALMGLNRLYNHYRAWRGKEYYSLSKAVKARVKQAVNHVSNFEEHIAALAKSRGCIGVMCGHIHTAADRMIGRVHYLNSGDWVESLTAVVEHSDGRFEVLEFADFRQRFPMQEAVDEKVAVGEFVDASEAESLVESI